MKSPKRPTRGWEALAARTQWRPAGPEGASRRLGGMHMKRLTAALAAAAIVVALCLAFAPDAKAQVSGLAFSAGAATDYRSKGLSKSADDGYVFATAEWKSADGPFYAGTAIATVDTPIGANFETDLKAGIRHKALGWDLDLAVFYRAFHEARDGTDADYVEFRAQASRSFGPVGVRLLTWETPDSVGVVERANWSEARVSYRAAQHLRVSAAVGYHSQDNGPSYAAWNAGASIDVAPKTELDLRWYDTDTQETGPRYQGEAVASLVYKF
ncbi:MAG: hypothetical protein EON88_20865 [Brevundimonas sp.]|nr:MAG: hypothetical protein EON88_20865 [Brevundimonas sp.]